MTIRYGFKFGLGFMFSVVLFKLAEAVISLIIHIIALLAGGIMA